MSGTAHFSRYMGLTIGQILERVFRLIRSHFKLLVGIACVPGLAFVITYGLMVAFFARQIIAVLHGGATNPAEFLPQFVPVWVIGSFGIMLVHLAVLAVYLAAASYAAVLADCGTPVTFGEAYRVAWLRAGHHVLLILTIYAVSFLPALLLQLPMFLGMAMMSTHHGAPNPALILLFPVMFLLVFVAVVAGAIVALRLSLAFPASVFESLDIRGALKRSWQLTRGALGRLFLVVLVVYAVVYALTMVVVGGAISVGVIAFLASSGPKNHISPHTIILLAICGMLAYLALIAACTVGMWTGFTTGFAVIYNDQRMRMDATSAGHLPSGAPA